MAEENRLSLTIASRTPGDEEVYFSDFRAVCNSVAECLRVSEQLVSGKRPKIRYRVVNLGMGSAHLELEAVRPTKGRDRRPSVLRFFRKTVNAIQTGKKLDRRVGPEEVEVFKQLSHSSHPPRATNRD